MLDALGPAVVGEGSTIAELTGTALIVGVVVASTVRRARAVAPPPVDSRPMQEVR